MRSCLLVLATLAPLAAASLQDLRVEYRTTPLGLDVEKPRFSWQMADPSARNLLQSAYQLQVRDPGGKLLWDSGRVESPTALAVPYAGARLLPTTRYQWSLQVWPNSGEPLRAESWFETGLLNPRPDPEVWSGARWIGGGARDLVLYSPYLAIFDLDFDLQLAPGSTRAAFVFGANDPRLLDKNKNIYQLQNAKDQSYVKLELDLSPLPGKALLHVYRVGYHASDSPSKPLKSLEIPEQAINVKNRDAAHHIAAQVAFGQITLSVNGNTALKPAGQSAPPQADGLGRRPTLNMVNVNPMGAGGDYLPFGLLCDIGFQLNPSQSARFRNLEVRNHRAPRSLLTNAAGLFTQSDVLRIENDTFALNGGAKGAFIVRDPSRNSAPMLRTTFQAKKSLKQARLYITARGIYEVFLNGKRVSDDYYNPGLTQYNVTHLYQTYDVTPHIKSGPNAIGAWLGEGWWSGLLSFGTIWNHFGDRQSLLAKLVLSYTDGSTETVVTSDRWKLSTDGPIRYGSLDFGEIYDASKERAIDGWTTAAYDDSRWKSAEVVPLEGTVYTGPEEDWPGRPKVPFHFEKLALRGQIGEPAGIYQILKAKSVKTARPGVYVYDLGQNVVGVPRIKLTAGAGRKITLRFAEMLYPSGPNSGMIMTENYRAALSTDVYTTRQGTQVYQPRFTSHGFQYVEITGLDKPLPPEAVEAVAISSVRSLTASYKSSNERVNRLWSNLVWSNVDNFLTIPTDCPQRNERMGWSGDISVFSKTATYVSNAGQFLTRHLRAMRDTQAASGRFTDVAPVGGGFGGVLWGSAGIVVAWEAYQQYGDLALLEEHYPAMARYIDFLQNTLDPKTGLPTDAQLGDWLGPQNNQLGTAFLATAYHAYDLGLMAQMAHALGKTADAARYARLYDERRDFFNKTFLDAENRTLALAGGRGFFGLSNGEPPKWTVADTQTSYATGLGMGLFPPDRRDALAARLAAAVERQNVDDAGKPRPPYSLMTGFIGTAWISQALSQNGQSALAYRLLQNRQYPSWLYAIDQGATTIWERLNGYTVEDGFGGNNSMNSFNHYSFGAVGQWLMGYSLGIRRQEPGFRRFHLRPEIDPTGEMKSAEGHYDSMYGRIESAWRVEGSTIHYKAVIPANTTATVFLPQGSIREAGQPVEPKRLEAGKAVFELGSGRYEYTIDPR